MSDPPRLPVAFVGAALVVAAVIVGALIFWIVTHEVAFAWVLLGAAVVGGLLAAQLARRRRRATP